MISIAGLLAYGRSRSVKDVVFGLFYAEFVGDWEAVRVWIVDVSDMRGQKEVGRQSPHTAVSLKTYLSPEAKIGPGASVWSKPVNTRFVNCKLSYLLSSKIAAKR